MRIRMVGTRHELRTAVSALADVADVDVVRLSSAPVDEAGRVRFRARVEVRLIPTDAATATEDRTSVDVAPAVATVTPIRRAVAR